MIKINVEMPKSCNTCPCVIVQDDLYGYGFTCGWCKELDVEDCVDADVRSEKCPIEEVKDND